MHPTNRLRPIATFLIALTLAGPALAADEPIETPQNPKRLGRDVVTRLDTLPDTAEAESNWFLENFEPAKQGLQFKHRFRPKSRDRDLVFSVRGPLIRKKTLGLKFEIRF